MNKKKHLYVFILIISLGIIIAGCSSKESPEEVFETYISHWIEEDFSSMYEMLSANTKEYISEEEFVDRYENIYGGIEGGNIQITFDEEEEFIQENDMLGIPFEFQMDTIVGTIEFEYIAHLVEGEDNWNIEWDESMIFPQMEQGDRIQVKTSPANRGRIIDFNGITLADTGEIQTIGIVSQDLGTDAEGTKETLAKAFEMTVEDIDRRLEADWAQPDLFVPIGSLSLEEESKILELTSLPGVMAQRQSARVYPLNDVTAHLVGYIGSISEEELEEFQGEGYNENSIIGKTGLEQLYEETLRATDGKTINIMKEDTTLRDVLGEREPEDGEDIQLTIDIHLQRQIYEEMGNEKGTAVAMDPKTGEVLALVNKPSYNPNQFVLGLSSQKWNDLNDDPDRPLSNRFSQIYSPGSVFKPVVAAIGLEDGSINPDERISISGLQWQKDASWGDYRVTRVSDPGSPVNLRDALVYSDNIYFAQSALNIGEEGFIEGGNKFGIGEEIDFEYSIRSSRLTNDDSFSGEILLADSGYGQGQVQVSPLHLTTMYTTFLNEGNMIKPTLIMGENDGSTYWKEEVIGVDTAQRIKDDLIQVIEHPQGTGSAAKIDGRVLGGKTGTAEFKESQSDEEGIKNGWFIAFDSQEENIIVTMMLEDVAGSSVVIPKVKNIIENYQD